MPVGMIQRLNRVQISLLVTLRATTVRGLVRQWELSMGRNEFNVGEGDSLSILISINTEIIHP